AGTVPVAADLNIRGFSGMQEADLLAAFQVEAEIERDRAVGKAFQVYRNLEAVTEHVFTRGGLSGIGLVVNFYLRVGFQTLQVADAEQDAGLFRYQLIGGDG